MWYFLCCSQAEENRQIKEEEEESRREAEEIRQAEEFRAVEQERFLRLVAEEQERKEREELERLEAEKQVHFLDEGVTTVLSLDWTIFVHCLAATRTMGNRLPINYQCIIVDRADLNVQCKNIWDNSWALALNCICGASAAACAGNSRHIIKTYSSRPGNSEVKIN